MIQTDSTVGCGSSTEVLQIAFNIGGDFGTDPLVKSDNVRNIFHTFHADSRTENLRQRLLGGLDSDLPVRLTVFIKKEAEFGNETEDSAEQIKHTGVTVALCTDNRVCENNSAGFSPGQDVALGGTVADFGIIAGAGKAVLVFQTDLVQLCFIFFLFGIHFLIENEFFKEVALYIFIVDGTGVDGEFALGLETCFDKLIHGSIQGLENTETERGNKVCIFISNGNKTLCTEDVTKQDNCFHDFLQSFALLTGQNVDLLGSQFHFVINHCFLPPLFFCQTLLYSKKN